MKSSKVYVERAEQLIRVSEKLYRAKRFEEAQVLSSQAQVYATLAVVASSLGQRELLDELTQAELQRIEAELDAALDND